MLNVIVRGEGGGGGGGLQHDDVQINSLLWKSAEVETKGWLGHSWRI